MFELIAIVSAILTPFLQKNGFSNLHYIDALVNFVVLPVVHLTNDEDTKAIIVEENWYQGLRYMIGVYNDPESRGMQQDNERDPVRRVRH